MVFTTFILKPYDFWHVQVKIQLHNEVLLPEDEEEEKKKKKKEKKRRKKRKNTMEGDKPQHLW